MLEGPLRGVPLVQRVIDWIREGGGEIEIHEPRPLVGDLSQACFSDGSPLPPSLRHWLGFDASWLVRTYPRFGTPSAVGFPLASWRRLIDDTIGAQVWGACYAALAGTPADGRGIALDCGSDSMRALFVGKPDEHGEYPVIWADVDDTPSLGIEWPGFDVWLAAEAGLVKQKQMLLYKRDIAAHVELNLAGATSVEHQGTWVGSARGAPIWAGEHAMLDARHEPPALPTGKTFAIVAPADRGPLAKMPLKKLSGALAEAIRAKDAIPIARLLEGARSQYPDRAAWKDAALEAAVDANDPDLVDRLIDLGASPDAPAGGGWLVLGQAAWGGRLASLDRLIARGADLERTQGASDQTALGDAAEQLELACLRALLAAGAKPDACSPTGMSALHQVASASHSPHSDRRPFVTALLDAGATIDLADHYKRTPLHWAVEHCVEVAELLVARGANVNAQNNAGDAPTHLAYEAGRCGLLAAMIARGADLELANAAGLRLTDVVQPDGYSPRELEVAVTCDATPREVELVVEWVLLATGYSTQALADVTARRIVDDFLERARPAPAVAEMTAQLELEPATRASYRRFGWRLRLAGVGADELAEFVRALVAPGGRAKLRARALRFTDVSASEPTALRFTTADAIAALKRRR